MVNDDPEYKVRGTCHTPRDGLAFCFYWRGVGPNEGFGGVVGFQGESPSTTSLKQTNKQQQQWYKDLNKKQQQPNVMSLTLGVSMGCIPGCPYTSYHINPLSPHT